MKVLHRILRAKLKTLDEEAPCLGIVWNYIPEEAIKKSWEIQMLGKMCSENLSKIHSEVCQKSNMEFLPKMVNGQKLLTIFAKSFNLDVS